MDATTAQNQRNAIDTIHQISELLDTGLDKETLSIAIGLIQQGVNPEGLAKIVQELRNSAQSKTEDTKMRD